ncbi:Man1-Src1p-C-terminal domain-containing protein [Limtongia smithiae]|uniref:Man1-Src1p-C-terminal domain-containing protein n=1 Tax=Limtongia smithiae TaxID=1125753 RepID=UPI0034CD4094
MDNTEYLQPDFDPQSLRVADLRRILIFHNVDFPSSAKKAVLIELFREHITPNSEEFARAKLSDGQPVPDIIDAHVLPVTRSRQQTQTPATPANSAAKTPATKKRSSARQATRTPRTSTRRRIVSSPEEEIVFEQEETIVTTAPSTEFGSDEAQVEMPTFSQENPFQTPRPQRMSGGSRKSVPSTLRKQNIETPFVISPPVITTPPDSVTGSRPSSRLSSPSERSTSASGSPALFASEYIISDESGVPILEDNDEEISDSEVEGMDGEVGDEHNDSLEPQSSSSFKFPVVSFLSWLAVVIGLSYLVFWRNEKFRIGYCDVTGLGTYVSSYEPNTLRWYIEPRCTPCPAHAICRPHFRSECESEFVQRKSLLAFGGLLPVAPTCAPDTAKLQRARILLEEIVHVLRVRNAEVQCCTDGSAGNDATMAQGELKQKLYSMKSIALSDEMFEELWALAWKDLPERAEIYVVDTTDTTAEERVGSSSGSEFPIGCILRREVRGFIEANKGSITSLVFITLVVLIVQNVAVRYRTRKAKVQELVRQCLSVLYEQQVQSDGDITGRTQRFVVVAQLKDRLLAHAHVDDAGERRRVWGDVQGKIEANANVRSRQMELHGEIMRIWEWIGM